MIKFEPKMIDVNIKVYEEGNDKNNAKIIAEPLERGYGTTIGNSLRRILLSALPGVAAKGFKIEGVKHEFDIIKGCKEEVTEIALKMKGVRFELVGDYELTEDIELSLRKNTPGKVLAGDIKTPGGIAVKNPDYVICTLDKGGEIDMTITVGYGRGYVQAENNKDANKPIGYIPLDSIYSPIVHASYEVEAARVGQNVDLDKLILSVKTDGTISSATAVTLAVKVMQEHLMLFDDLDKKVEVEIFETEQKPEPKKVDRPIESLGLSTRSLNGLKRFGIQTVEQLLENTEQQILDVPNLGAKSIEDIKERLAENNLSFADKK